MHDNGVTLQKKVLQNLDIPYSYELAKRMEQYRSHPTLYLNEQDKKLSTYKKGNHGKGNPRPSRQ